MYLKKPIKKQYFLKPEDESQQAKDDTAQGRKPCVLHGKVVPLNTPILGALNAIVRLCLIINPYCETERDQHAHT